MKLIKPSEVKTDDIKPPRVNNRNYYIRVIDKKSKNRKCILSFSSVHARLCTRIIIKRKFHDDIVTETGYANTFTRQEKDNTFQCITYDEAIEIIKRIFNLSKQNKIVHDEIKTTDDVETILGNINKLIKVKS